VSSRAMASRIQLIALLLASPVLALTNINLFAEQHIRALQPRFAATATSSVESNRLVPEKVRSFNAWLQSNGVKSAKVSLGVADEEHGGGLGLRVNSGGGAAASVGKGEVLVSVPFSVCFDAAASRKELSPFLNDFDGWTGAAGCIAVHLMREFNKGPESAWAPWLALLPEAGQTGALDLPLFWPPQAAAVLEGCSTRPITELQVEADEDFAWLEENVFEPHRGAFPAEAFSALQWRKCLGLALSRSCFVSGATRVVPLLDFVNHDDLARGEFTGPEGSGGVAKAAAALGSLSSKMFGGSTGGEVKFVAERSYESGEEACVSYGTRTCSEYLEEFGFVPSSTASGSSLAELVFGLDEDVSACFSDKADVLEEAGLDLSASFEVSSARGGEPDPALVQFLRLVLLDKQDLFLLEPVFRNEVLDFMALPVSKENEKSVADFVIARCMSGLSELEKGAARQAEVAEAAAATTSATDGGTVGRALAMASAVRKVEAEALKTTAAWWRRDSELLRLKEYYQERRLKDLNLDKPWSPEGEVESSFSVGRAPGNADWS